ncbi:MAG: YraN family protein [Proteobacteria bacterium]|nr:YraN family protein [Pseudomonadota bacterium]MCK4867113.1 YraN family protein [Alphaproteobacteria bacterium]
MSREERQRAWRRGWWAETLCMIVLKLRGYRILSRRLRTPVGEIDILARRGRTLAIIEVKARDDFASAADSVTDRQKQRLIRAAGWVVAGRPDLASLDTRFDVMLVAPRRLPHHVVDAWRADAQWLQSRGQISW